MISVIVTARDERKLARSLAALVPAAVEGLVREVSVIDLGSQKGIAMIAEAAGCRLVRNEADLAGALARTAAEARSPFLLFLSGEVMLGQAWAGLAEDFIDEANSAQRAALFLGRGARASVAMPDSLALRFHLFRPAPPAMGVLLPTTFYAELNAHQEQAREGERALARKIGARRLSLMRAPAERRD